MKQIFSLLFLFSIFSFGQCPDFNKLETDGSYLYKTNNYIPFEIKYNDSIYLEDVFYPFDIKLIEKYSTPILLKATSYIVDRAGKNFYNNLIFECMEVNYPETVKVEYENTKLYNLENYDVKYWLKYTYSKNNYKYGFCLLFDKFGNMISENKFPNIFGNPNFENYTNPCEALNLVKNDENFKGKQIDFVELAYLDEINSFCWLIKEKKLPQKLGINKYTLDSYLVNANSNKLMKVTTEDVTSIACGIDTKKKTGERKNKEEKGKKYNR